MSKQFSQQVLKSSEFSKNKSKKIVYGKADMKTSPDHSRSTNFYLPERKEPIKPKVKGEKEGRLEKQGKDIKKGQNKSKGEKKSKVF
jgi:hypothetical protein